MLKKHWLKMLRRDLNSADKTVLEVVSLHPEIQMQKIENQRDFISITKFKVTIKILNDFELSNFLIC